MLVFLGCNIFTWDLDHVEQIPGQGLPHLQSVCMPHFYTVLPTQSNRSLKNIWSVYLKEKKNVILITFIYINFVFNYKQCAIKNKKSCYLIIFTTMLITESI